MRSAAELGAPNGDGHGRLTPQLGRSLPERKAVWVALARFKGIGVSRAKRICSRLQLHRTLTVDQLSDPQVNALAALLSSPTYTSPAPRPIALPEGITLTPDERRGLRQTDKPRTPLGSRQGAWTDDLIGMKIDGDLVRHVRENIAREFNLGTERGRLHNAGLPVRGQRTRPNARTARRLNKLQRSAFSTRAASAPCVGVGASTLTEQIRRFATGQPRTVTMA